MRSLPRFAPTVTKSSSMRISWQLFTFIVPVPTASSPLERVSDIDLAKSRTTSVIDGCAGKQAPPKSLPSLVRPLGIAATISPLPSHLRLDIISIEALGGMGQGYASGPRKR